MIEDIICGAIALLVVDNDRALTRDTPPDLTQSNVPATCPNQLTMQTSRNAVPDTWVIPTANPRITRSAVLKYALLSAARWQPTISQGRFQHLIHSVS